MLSKIVLCRFSDVKRKRKNKAAHRKSWVLVLLMDELFFGPRAKRNYQRAFALANLLCGNQEAIAYRYLAHAYDCGIGVKRDLRKAFDNWKKALLLGDVESQAALAHAYAEGLGVKKSLTRAIYWDGLAARRGDTTAQYNLGQAYATGLGVEKTPRVAFKWWLKAAEQGHAKGQCNVAAAYETGFGIRKDINAAKKWYERSLRSGDKLARTNLERLRKQGRIN
jgi:TPR repeat protein